jgi:RNA polymerase sigma-70 factor (family 1)
LKKYETYSDEQLVALLKESDEIAFKAIYDKYWKLLFTIAFSKIDSFNDAEEIVQEIFTDIWARRASLPIKRSLKYYLAAAVKYQVISIFANRSKHASRNEMYPDLLISKDTSDQSIHFTELIRELESIVSALPERCKLVYRLSREEELSHKEIAEKLGISPKTVETQITRALAHIRKGLGDAAFSLVMFIL